MGIHMSEFFKRDKTLDALAFSKDLDDLLENCASSVTITYGGDGSMLPEIFDNGAILVKEAGSRDIWLIWDSDRAMMFFFIGRLKAVKDKIKKFKDREDMDEERAADEAGEGGG